MKRGDKRYVCYGKGVLSTYTFLEECIVPGADKPTWLMKDQDGRKVRVTKYYGHPTPKSAYTKWVQDAVFSIENGYKYIEATQATIRETYDDMNVVLDKINNLTSKECVVQ